MTGIAKIIAAAVLGLYLALVPFLSPLFSVHNSTCPCHKPLRILERRGRALRSLVNWPDTVRRPDRGVDADTAVSMPGDVS